MNIRLFTALALAGASAAGAAQAQIAASGFSTNPNVLAVGNALDAIPGAPTPAEQQVLNAFAQVGPSAAGREQALLQYTPAAFSLVPELLSRTAEFQQQNVLRYLRDYRAGGTGVEGAAGEARPGDRQLGFWGAVRANHGGYNAFNDRPNVNVNDYGVQLGLDGRFGEKSVLGITGGYHIVNPRLYNATRRSSLRNWFVGGYTSLAAGPAYIDAYGSYGEGEMNLNRAVSFGGLSQVTSPSRADGDSRTWLVGGNIGLSFNVAGFEFEPTAGVRYTNIRFGPINDLVGGQQQFGGLLIGEQVWTSLQSNVGARIGGAFQVGQATVRPEVRGSWRREWREDDARTIRYSIFGAPGTLAYTTTPLGRDYLVVGGGASVSGPGSPLSFVVDWTGEFLGGRNIYGISGGLRLTF